MVKLFEKSKKVRFALRKLGKKCKKKFSEKNLTKNFFLVFGVKKSEEEKKAKGEKLSPMLHSPLRSFIHNFLCLPSHLKNYTVHINVRC